MAENHFTGKDGKTVIISGDDVTSAPDDLITDSIRWQDAHPGNQEPVLGWHTVRGDDGKPTRVWTGFAGQEPPVDPESPEGKKQSEEALKAAKDGIDHLIKEHNHGKNPEGSTEKDQPPAAAPPIAEEKAGMVRPMTATQVVQDALFRSGHSEIATGSHKDGVDNYWGDKTDKAFAQACLDAGLKPEQIAAVKDNILRDPQHPSEDVKTVMNFLTDKVNEREGKSGAMAVNEEQKLEHSRADATHGHSVENKTSHHYMPETSGHPNAGDHLTPSPTPKVNGGGKGATINV